MFECLLAMKMSVLKERFFFLSFFPKIFIYDGKTGEKVGSLGGNKAHDGGIYAVSISDFIPGPKVVSIFQHSPRT